MKCLKYLSKIVFFIGNSSLMRNSFQNRPEICPGLFSKCDEHAECVNTGFDNYKCKVLF